MIRKILALIGFGIVLLTSCKQNKNHQMTDIEVWKLGWRMIASSIEENYELSNSQFDSLRNNTEITNREYLLTGLEAKIKLGKSNEVSDILNSLDKNMLQDICPSEVLSGYKVCEKYSIEEVDNKELQIELIKMYINDQYIRSNLMTELLDKYDLTKNNVIIDSFGINTDERNRARLKEIFEEYGFPTKKLVGRDAMNGIFFIIQHSDRDKVWQKSQLDNVKKAVESDDMDSQCYAYLYDRIKINSREKQLYGTQFSKVDPINKIVEIAETEDIENLDRRRMEMGMMPIKMYKKYMLKN